MFCLKSRTNQSSSELEFIFRLRTICLALIGSNQGTVTAKSSTRFYLMWIVTSLYPSNRF